MSHHLQALIMKEPAQLGISEWESVIRDTASGEMMQEAQDLRPTQWYPLLNASPASAEGALRALGLRRTDPWVVQSGGQAHRLLFVANVQRIPSWIQDPLPPPSKTFPPHILGQPAEPQPPVSPSGLDG